MADVALEEGPGPRLPWAVPEIVAITVLGTVGLLALGGLAAGIYVAMGFFPPAFDPFETVWNSITFGASWADPLVALFLLGAAGLCWWHADRWTDDFDDSTQSSEPAVEYIHRSQRLASLTLWGLSVTTLGAIAGLVANLGLVVLRHSGEGAWYNVIRVIASTIAILGIEAVGWLVVRQTKALGG